jgi:hypothetical protein
MVMYWAISCVYFPEFSKSNPKMFIKQYGVSCGKNMFGSLVSLMNWL